MPSRVTKDFMCDDCGVEYMVTFDEDNVIDQPMHCPFCSSLSQDYDEMDIKNLDFDDDDE